MDEEDEGPSDRLASQTLIPIMVEAYHIGLREAGSLSRWLLATLAVTNGAAVISILPLQMATAAKLGAAGAFVVGIVAAMGAGLWSLVVFRRVSSAAGTMIGYWLTVADDGDRIQALESTMKTEMDKAVGSRGTLSLGALSAALFLMGSASAAWGLLSR
jgi:hypothetical protein